MIVFRTLYFNDTPVNNYSNYEVINLHNYTKMKLMSSCGSQEED